MKEYFLPIAFHDEALLHAILGCSGSYDTVALGRGELRKAVFHLNESIRIVNDRLRSMPPTVDEPTILVVATMAYLEVRPCSLSYSQANISSLEIYWTRKKLGDPHAGSKANDFPERWYSCP